MNPHLGFEKVETAISLSAIKMCGLFLIRQGVTLAFMVFATAAFSGDFKPGPLGAVEIERGQPIEIHLLLSATVVPSVSSAIRTAIEMAIKDFGSIHGRQVFIEAHDELCSREGGRAVAEAVVANAQVVGVIGTLCSGAAVGASPVISEVGLSMISPSNTSPALTSDLFGNAGPDYHQGYYRVADNSLIDASIVAQFSHDELGLRTMVTIHDGDAYSKGISNAFAVAFREYGGTVPVIAQVAKGQTDMASVLGRFDEAGPDGVFISLFPAEATSFIKKLAQRNTMEGVTIISGTASFVTEFLALPESEGTYFTGPDFGDSRNTNQATGRSYADVLAAFIATYGGPSTSPYWAHGYDATTLLLSAIKQIAVVDGGDTLYIDHAALRNALDGTVDFQGIIGTMTCDDFGDCGTGRSVVHLHADSSVTDPSLLPIVYKGARDSHLPQ